MMNFWITFIVYSFYMAKLNFPIISKLIISFAASSIRGWLSLFQSFAAEDDFKYSFSFTQIFVFRLLSKMYYYISVENRFFILAHFYKILAWKRRPYERTFRIKMIIWRTVYFVTWLDMKIFLFLTKFHQLETNIWFTRVQRFY